MDEANPRTHPAANGTWNSLHQLRDRLDAGEDPLAILRMVLTTPLTPSAAARLALDAAALTREELTTDAVRRLIDRHQTPGHSAPTDRVDPARSGAVVYYVAVQPFVKIGTTTDLDTRLVTYPPYRRLLATEPGGVRVEGIRLTQFAADLAYGREWFRPSAALIEHINTLRDTPFTPAELTA